MVDVYWPGRRSTLEATLGEDNTVPTGCTSIRVEYKARKDDYALVVFVKP